MKVKKSAKRKATYTATVAGITLATSITAAALLHLASLINSSRPLWGQGSSSEVLILSKNFWINGWAPYLTFALTTLIISYALLKTPKTTHKTITTLRNKLTSISSESKLLTPIGIVTGALASYLLLSTTVNDLTLASAIASASLTSLVHAAPKGNMVTKTLSNMNISTKALLAITPFIAIYRAEDAWGIPLTLAITLIATSLLWIPTLKINPLPNLPSKLRNPLNKKQEVPKKTRKQPTATPKKHASKQRTRSNHGTTQPDANSESNLEGWETPSLSLKHVGGYRDVKKELKRKVVNPMNEDNYKELGVSPANGILFHGPPGTGKTMISKALAGETGLPFKKVTAGDLMSKWVNESTQNLNKLLKEAEEEAPCIILLDEIDTIIGDRNSSTHKEDKKLVSEFLSKVNKENEFILIGTTNKYDELDKAATRKGRFGLHLEMGVPGTEVRKKIFKTKLTTVPNKVTNEELQSLAEKTEKLTGADIESIIDKGKLMAAENGKSRITYKHLDTAVTNVQNEETTSIRNHPNIDFNDVGGYQELKEELKTKVIEPMNKDSYDELGISPAKGVLLHGPPGTGKTMISKALAGETGLPFKKVTAGDLMSKWVNESTQNLNKLLKEAEEEAPCVILLDEIDTLISSRNSANTNSEDRKFLAEFLSRIGDSDREYIVVATTNKYENLDKAAIRKGRFDLHLEMELPGPSSRHEILETKLRDTPNELTETHKADIVKKTNQFSGVDIESLVTEAKYIAANNNDNKITYEHLKQAINNQS